MDLDINFKQCNSARYRKCDSRTIKYIVIHYTANNGDTAKGNATYFANDDSRQASAHYFVDENEIWQSVKDNDIAWHCGGGLQGTGGHTFYKICTNTNSIGIEMCSKKDSSGTYYIEDDTISNVVKLTRSLMAKYNVDVSRVVRHYDVTGKICPRPFVDDPSQWTAFKNRLTESEEDEMTQDQFNTFMNNYLEDLSKQDPSNWSSTAREWAEDNKIITGNENGDKQYKSFCTREQMVQFLYRLANLK